MQYKLINRKTSESHLCDKITTDGFDYYVSDIIENRSGKIAYINNNVYKNELRIVTTAFGNDNLKDCKKVIATTNPSIDCPKVVDEVENIAYKWFVKANKKDAIFGLGWVNIFKGGYNKAKETHPNSDEDMIEFLNWVGKDGYPCIDSIKKGLWVLHPQEPKDFTPKELLQLWKEQKPKIVYFDPNNTPEN